MDCEATMSDPAKDGPLEDAVWAWLDRNYVEKRWDVPEGYCPVCTKELCANGWCFECRRYPRRASA